MKAIGPPRCLVPALLVALGSCFTVEGSYDRGTEGLMGVGGAVAGAGGVDASTGPDGMDLGTGGLRPAPTSTSSCAPRSIRAVTQPGFAQQETSAPVCAIDAAGILSMRYPTVAGCDEDMSMVRPYRACYFGQNEDLSQFQRGIGLMEAHYCFQGPLYEDVNLWIDNQATGAALTALRLHAGDDPTAQSCRTMLFSALDTCANSSSCNSICTGSTNDLDGGMIENAPTADTGNAAPPALRCSQFERVKLRITAEWCQCPETGCEKPPEAEIELRSLVYYPESCLCNTDADCAPGSFCRKDALAPDAECWKPGEVCRGVCRG